MKVLVTGGAGFLGSHVCEYYRIRGDTVIAYDNLTKHELLRTGYHAGGARDYMVSFLSKIGAELIIGDVRDKVKMRKAAEGADYIVHCAAQPAMTIALEDPCFDAAVNVTGTINILDIARELNIPIVTCSTIHVYGNGINHYLTPKGTKLLLQYYPDSDLWDGEQTIGEDAPILTGYITPLHASKRALEIYTRMFIESYKSKAAVFRLTGMYGLRQFGGEDHGWVANFAIRTVMGLPITVFNINKAELYGNSKGVVPGTRQGRDIIYVTDAVEAIAKWYENGQPSGLYNIGGGEKTLITLGDCLKTLKEISGQKQNIIFKPPRFGDLYYFACDSRKALDAFGWSPATAVESGLESLVNWIKENKALFKGGEK